MPPESGSGSNEIVLRPDTPKEILTRLLPRTSGNSPQPRSNRSPTLATFPAAAFKVTFGHRHPLKMAKQIPIIRLNPACPSPTGKRYCPHCKTLVTTQFCCWDKFFASGRRPWLRRHWKIQEGIL